MSSFIAGYVFGLGCGMVIGRSMNRGSSSSSSDEGPDSREAVSGASLCSGPRSGADKGAALVAKPTIQPRGAGLNPSHEAPANAGSVHEVVGSQSQNEGSEG